MNRITIDGVEYRVRFRHCHTQGYVPRSDLRFEELEELVNRERVIADAFQEALGANQVKVHQLGFPPELEGVTICTIEDNNVRKVLAIGYAFCSYPDQFSKAKGRKIALDRARHNLAQRKTIGNALEMDL